MDAFAADMKKEMDMEIRKLSKRISDGDLPGSQVEMKKQLVDETEKVEADLITAFHKDLNLTLEKEIKRIGKRVLHT